ncbi:MAG: Gfo/Idh/MocA family oxidoreductase [Phycisphaerales bacterium]|nr:Gfo/Idh/MocA family oxidoreductase [Phycisphaerales bacterium]
MRTLILLAICVGVSMLAACARSASYEDHHAEPRPQPKLSTQTGPLRIGVAGLVHGHVEGLLYRASQGKDVVIVGVYEPNRALFDRLASKYNLDPALYHADLAGMLDAGRPEAVSVMSSIKDHLPIAQVCAPRGVHMLMEKPLAFTTSDAAAMRELASKHRVLILTNFETSWYASVREAQRCAEADGPPLRKLVFRHGHKGPVEIGCSPEFLAWLTDPEQNGGGAVVDFGCYGAAISTWMMRGQRPTSVVASLATSKPGVYARVDDNATILLTYPGATSIIQASWAWTHDNKEMDVYSEGRSFHAGKWDALTTRRENADPVAIKPPPMPEHLKDEWVYLRKVIRGQCEVDPLSSLELNVIVAEILDQARQSRQR